MGESSERSVVVEPTSSQRPGSILVQDQAERDGEQEEGDCVDVMMVAGSNVRIG